jgi:hypothetical protein
MNKEVQMPKGRAINVDGIEMSIGNTKIGNDTLIFNITSAHDCPSAKLGFCQLPNSKACYARRGERHPVVKAFRRRQTEQFDRHTVSYLAYAFLKAQNKYPNIKYLRISESGDFRSQADVQKISSLAEFLNGYMRVYTYTARKDLDFSDISENLVLNGSGFMLHNRFLVVKHPDPSKPLCPMDCSKCNWCKVKNRKTIQVIYR